MRDIAVSKLQCKKMVFVESKSMGRSLTEEIEIDLIHVKSGSEGGDFDDLEIEIKNKELILDRLKVGDKILIDCYSKVGKGRSAWWQMFEKPVEIEVVEVEDGDAKKFQLDRYCTGGGWCFNLSLN